MRLRQRPVARASKPVEIGMTTVSPIRTSTGATGDDTRAKHAIGPQFLRFLLVGGSATAIQYVILVALHQGLGVAATLASAVGFALSAIYNFVVSYHFTFRGRTSMLGALPRYALVVAIGLAINTAIFDVALHVFELPYLLAQVVATGVVLVWNFSLARAFVFGATESK